MEEHEIDEALVKFLSHFSDEQKFNSKLKEIEITEEELRARLELHVRVGKFLAGKFDYQDESCEEKLLKFFEANRELFITDDKIRLSHVLIEGYCEEVRECAENIRREISSAEDFKFQVQTASHCPSCLQNGDLGYLLKGELIPELDEIAFGMKPGEISDVIKTPYGYHILMVTECIPARQLEFEEVREFLSQYHQNLLMELNVEKYLNELRQKADIKIF